MMRSTIVAKPVVGVFRILIMFFTGITAFVCYAVAIQKIATMFPVITISLIKKILAIFYSAIKLAVNITAIFCSAIKPTINIIAIF